MFDWDDEELANIIWDEGAESGDHIVPYPKGSEDCCNKKEWKQEATIIKPTEQKIREAKIDLHSKKLESSSNLVSNDKSSDPRMGVESWPDLPLSNAADSERQSMGTEVSNGLSEITKYDSSKGTDQHDKDAEIYESSHEGKEQGDFVDYGWANIGSFDDFDRIFSNDDAVFGHTSLANGDELWSSSRDVTNSPDKSFPISSELPNLSPKTLRNTSQQLEIKTEFVQEDDLCSLHYGKTDDSTSHNLQRISAILDPVEDVGSESKPMAKVQTVGTVGKTTLATSNPDTKNVPSQNETAEKVRQKKLFKSRKRLDVKSEGKQLHELYGSWSSPRNPSGELENRLAHSVTQPSPSPVPQMQLQQCPEIFQYHHISNQFLPHPVYGNLTNPFPAMPVLSHIQPAKFKHQPLLSSYEVSPANSNPVNKSAEAPVKRTTMTPQEKIEKLRRRQQLQAMLAIQKQQQQLSQQISSTNLSTTQTCPQQTTIQQFGGTDLGIEDLSGFPSLEPNSPKEEDDSNTISAVMDDYSVEETILHRLQDIITKLDMTVRLCIRDSLFRLAHSAMQRHYTSDTGSTNTSSKDEHETLTKEEINSYNRLPIAETETNPIDRTVAHLLFHRPLEFSGKQPETSESALSAKLSSERRAATVVNLPETLRKNKESFGYQESKVSSGPDEPDQYKDSPRVDILENASKNGLADGVTIPAVESSQ